MTTHAFSTRIRHDSDAVYREWVQEFHNALAAIGLVQTADTGQANISALTRPGSDTFNAYEIWRFGDSLQSSAPIFIRFDYGTGGGSLSSPKVGIIVGTGSNGSGTLTQTGMSGTLVTTARQLASGGTGGSQQTSDTAKPSKFCHAAGFLGISWKHLAGSPGFGLPGLFAICRTCDNTGTPDGRGMMLDWGNNQGNPTRQAVRFTATAQAFTAQTAAPNSDLGMMPQAPTNTVVDGINQVALGWTITPLAEPLFGLCGVYPNEVPYGHTFQATLVGVTPRTYISIQDWAFGSPTTMRVAMLWE
jgi:hypothetical protein